jgi:hypothetical protein
MGMFVEVKVNTVFWRGNKVKEEKNRKQNKRIAQRKRKIRGKKKKD